MNSLTETAYQTRKAINIIILSIIGYIILRIVWGIFFSILLTIFPPKPPPPNNAFGKLPAVKFPSVSKPTTPLKFTLQTISGSVPKASESAAVYFMPKNAPNLLALTKTQQFAQKLNFNPNPIPVGKNLYQFDDDINKLRKLSYDIVSNNFSIRYLYEVDTGLFDRTPDSTSNLLREAQQFIGQNNLQLTDYNSNDSKITYLKLSGNKLISTTSLSQSDAVKIDYFRKPINQLKVLTPFPGTGSISFTFSGSKDPKKHLLLFSYTYWPIEYKTTATYKLKTSQEAWQELQNGGGYIAHFPTGDTAVIRDVYVAYYDSIEPQNFLQPIYVFEGDEGFIGYVAAIAPPWTE